VIVQLTMALLKLSNQHSFATGRQLGSVPYLEEAVALFEDPKGSFKSRDRIHFVIMMIGARGTLANCYYKLGRYDDAAAIATRAVQACKVRPSAVLNAHPEKYTNREEDACMR
jgi:tetratricopeptide (TPR) repeat protein